MSVIQPAEIPSWVKLHDLASDRVGGKVLYSTDDFFAEKENLIKHEPAVWIADKYTDMGKWMDGWESRRRRGEGHDWCLIKLGLPGTIVGVDVDTSYFNGNHPHAIKIEGVNLKSDKNESDDAVLKKLLAMKDSDWTTVIAMTDTFGTTHNYRAVPATEKVLRETVFTHLRYHMFPDGGTARLRIYGEVQVDWNAKALANASGLVDLAAFENGGIGVACSDEHFGKMKNLVMPGRGINMGDGWETRRRRGPGFDWIIVKLGVPGKIKKIEIDTAHFKGADHMKLRNFPHQFSLEANTVQKDLNPVVALGWNEILPKNFLKADHIHEFDLPESASQTVYNYVKLCIYPDGGVSRLRIWGTPVQQ